MAPLFIGVYAVFVQGVGAFAKLGQDGRDTGATVVATGYAGLMFDVDIGSL